MAKITKYGIDFYSNFWLLPKKFLAITLFGKVFSNKNTEELKQIIESSKGLKLAYHEGWHITQSKDFKLGWVGFYVYYIAYWFRNLFMYPSRAYRMIPFEREAYDKADGKMMNPEGCKSEWRLYR